MQKLLPFPTSKIELHQWANTILLSVVGFFAINTYMVITADHEKLAGHETRITVIERTCCPDSKQTSQLEAVMPENLRRKKLMEPGNKAR